MKNTQDKELAQLRESLENQKAEIEALGQEVPSLRKEIMHFVEQTNKTVHALVAPFSSSSLLRFEDNTLPQNYLSGGKSDSHQDHYLSCSAH